MKQWQRSYGLQSLKYLLSGHLQKSSLTSGSRMPKIWSPVSLVSKFGEAPGLDGQCHENNIRKKGENDKHLGGLGTHRARPAWHK